MRRPQCIMIWARGCVGSGGVKCPLPCAGDRRGRFRGRGNTWPGFDPEDGGPGKGARDREGGRSWPGPPRSWVWRPPHLGLGGPEHRQGRFSRKMDVAVQCIAAREIHAPGEGLHPAGASATNHHEARRVMLHLRAAYVSKPRFLAAAALACRPEIEVPLEFQGL